MNQQTTPPWTDAGLHGRMSHQEGLQQANEDHQSRTDRRLQILEEGHAAHGKEITSLKEISNKLEAINTTLLSLKDEIREPLKVYNKYTNFKDGLWDLGKVIIFVSVFIGAYNIVFPAIADWIHRSQTAREAANK